MLKNCQLTNASWQLGDAEEEKLSSDGGCKAKGCFMSTNALSFLSSIYEMYLKERDTEPFVFLFVIWLPSEFKTGR